MEHLAEHISDSKWYSTMADYYFQQDANSTNIYVNGTVRFKQSIFDQYSLGKNLSYSDMGQIIENNLNGQAADPNGAYFIFGSPDIRESILDAESACGYHSYTEDLADYDTYFAYIQVRSIYLILESGIQQSL